MRSTNREIRLLLKLLRRPHALEREALAIMLREALHAENAHSAVMMAIDSAFDTATSNGRLLKEIIQRCDIDGQTTGAAAADVHLSLRQFFRYRTDAIEAIAQSVGRSLRQPDESSRKQLVMASMVAEFDSRAALDMYVRAAPSPTGKTAFEIARAAIWAGVEPSRHIEACEGAWRLLALATQARRFLSIGMRAESEYLVDKIRVALGSSSGPLYDSVAFELAELDRRALRRRGLMREQTAVVERMRKLARDDSRLVALALLAESEAACSAGELTTAEIAVADAERIAIERRELYLLARSTFASASLSLLRGHIGDALALFNATAPTIAAFDAAYALRAAAFAGRCALLLDVEWRPPSSLMERHAGSWIFTEIACIEARRLMGADPTAALARAEVALDRAKTTDAEVATLFARTTLAAALDKSGRTAEAKREWLGSWSEGMRIGDQTMLVDLFAVPHAVERDVGPLALDDDLLDAIQRFQDEQAPATSSSISASVRDLKVALVRLCLAGAIGRPPEFDRIDAVKRAAANALAGLRVSGEQIMRFGHSASRETCVAVSWLLPPSRRLDFRSSFVAHWERYVDDVAAHVAR
ncbi:MAG TPA: hypothetical protein VJN22_02100 [Candidatus Eremiobacteraceae bacterium]|nr:hypothetical protein [Candidatus Eremiobacteraceae bacterium]